MFLNCDDSNSIILFALKGVMFCLYVINLTNLKTPNNYKIITIFNCFVTIIYSWKILYQLIVGCCTSALLLQYSNLQASIVASINTLSSLSIKNQKIIICETQTISSCMI